MLVATNIAIKDTTTKMIFFVLSGFLYFVFLAECSSDKYHWRNLTPPHYTNTHLKWRYRPYRYGGYVKSVTTTTEATAVDSSKVLKIKKSGKNTSVNFFSMPYHSSDLY